MDLSSLHIIFLAGTLGQGGAERQLYYILKTMKSERANVSLLCLTQGEFWEDPIRRLGIPITWVGKNSNPLFRLIEIIRETRKSKSSIIQSHHFYTNPYSAVTARFLGIKCIGAVRNDVYSEIRANGCLFGNISLRLPYRLAVNSLNGQKNAIKIGIPENRILILKNVVDCKSFFPIRKLENEQINVLTIGRFVEEKKLDQFLECFAQVKCNSKQNIQGWLVGNGPLLPSIKSKAGELELGSECVRFFDNVADPTSIYQKADVFMLTSVYEGMPNVIMEAMACGLPIIATNVGDIPDLIKHGETGFLVKPGDTTDMVFYLKLLLENPNLRKRLGDAARKYILDEYDFTQLRDILEKFYDNIY